MLSKNMEKADDLVKKKRLKTETLTKDCKKKRIIGKQEYGKTKTLEWISISNDSNKKRKKEFRQMISGQSGIYEGFRKFHFGNIRNQSRSVTYDGSLDH